MCFVLFCFVLLSFKAENSIFFTVSLKNRYEHSPNKWIPLNHNLEDVLSLTASFALLLRNGAEICNVDGSYALLDRWFAKHGECYICECNLWIMAEVKYNSKSELCSIMFKTKWKWKKLGTFMYHSIEIILTFICLLIRLTYGSSWVWNLVCFSEGWT